MTGAILSETTYAFVLDGPKTWLECNDLYDSTNSAYIDIFTMPNGKVVLSIQAEVDEVFLAYTPVVYIDLNSPIVIGNTYEFLY